MVSFFVNPITTSVYDVVGSIFLYTLPELVYTEMRKANVQPLKLLFFKQPYNYFLLSTAERNVVRGDTEYKLIHANHIEKGHFF